MPFTAHRARSGSRFRETVIAGSLIAVLAVTGVTLSQLVSGDDTAESAQDTTGDPTGLEPPIILDTAPRSGQDAAGSTGEPTGKSAGEPTSDTEGESGDDAATALGEARGAEDREASRRLDAAVEKRSQALGDLVELAEKKAAEDEAAARRAVKKAAKADAAASGAPFSLTIGSFNVLGSQHTAPGGDRPSFPPASVRSAGAAGRIADHGVDIVGMQELQDDQLNALQSRTGMAAYPGFQWGAAETDNSILYDPSRFEFVSGDRFTIPFMGRPRPQPILRLRERSTGREFYVVNTHPSAHDGPYLAERRQGQATLVSVVNGLKQSGLPVLVTGDMNDRELFYCNVVPQAGLTAPNGGSYSGGCSPPPGSIPVDWVVGSGVSWSSYWRDTTPVTSKVSDHFFISATAAFG